MWAVGAFYGCGSFDPNYVNQIRRWDPRAEIELRGSMLHELGRIDQAPSTPAQWNDAWDHRRHEIEHAIAIDTAQRNLKQRIY